MDKKAKIKAGLGFGVAMTIFFISRNLFTNDDLGVKNIAVSVISGIMAGGIAGLLFGWLTGIFANSKYAGRSIKLVTETGETVVFETGANHFKGAEAVGGKLFLTNQRLVFISHKFNVQNHELSLQLSDIRDVKRYKSLGIVNNGLSVSTVRNTEEKFVVQRVAEWMDHLTKQV